jgi:hypothetical protein
MAGTTMVEKFVGFYWTLPVTIAGFRHLPLNDVEAAAERSKTVRYQMHLCRRWIADNPGTKLIDERVFIELSPDRGTNAILDELKLIRRKCPDPDLKIFSVRFADSFNWRSRHQLYDYIDRYFPNSVHHSPEPLHIDGVLFDPIAHFEKSRERFKQESARLKGAWLGELQLSWSQYCGVRGWPKHVAIDLNNRRVRTKTGRPWSPENVTKQVERFGRAWSSPPSVDDPTIDGAGET